MLKIERLKDYLDTTTNEEFIKLAAKIYVSTSFNCRDYPRYKEWYFTKQLPGIKNNERDILFVRNPKDYNDIIAVACLKKSKEEKKLCTLYVSDKYRNLGLGTCIIEKAMNYLETTKPLATIADYKLDMFIPIINKYNWELVEIVKIYNNKSNELCFNGRLVKDSTHDLKKELQKRFINILNKRIDNIDK